MSKFVESELLEFKETEILELQKPEKYNVEFSKFVESFIKSQFAEFIA
jgi:hypothetical protein